MIYLLLAPGTQNDEDDDSGGDCYCWGRISESDALSPHHSDLDLFITELSLTLANSCQEIMNKLQC